MIFAQSQSSGKVVVPRDVVKIAYKNETRCSEYCIKKTFDKYQDRHFFDVNLQKQVLQINVSDLSETLAEFCNVIVSSCWSVTV